MNSSKESIILTTVYLFAYAILINIGIPGLLAGILGVIWPFTFIWMIFCILKDDSQKYPELKEGEEWGYRDKKRDEMKIF